MTERKSGLNGARQTTPAAPPGDEPEEVLMEKFRATYLGLWRICVKRRCRRARLCAGPPTCIDLNWDIVEELWPDALARINRELDAQS
jgi:hypothetical protein